jgi:hypothetical protein
VPCPGCDQWRPRRDWATAEGEVFPFRIVSPRCGPEEDVGDLDYRLGTSTKPRRE